MLKIIFYIFFLVSLLKLNGDNKDRHNHFKLLDTLKKNNFINEQIIEHVNDVLVEEVFSDFYYRIQIFALENPIYSDNLRLFLNFINKEIYFNEDTKLTSYLVGRFTRYSDAFFLKEYMIDNGLQDIFIVGFIGGKRITDINEVIKYERKKKEVIYTDNLIK